MKIIQQLVYKSFIVLFCAMNIACHKEEEAPDIDLFTGFLKIDSVRTDRDIDINWDGKAEHITKEIPEISNSGITLSRGKSDIYIKLYWIEPLIDHQLLMRPLPDNKNIKEPLEYKTVGISYYGTEYPDRVEPFKYSNTGYQYTYALPSKIELKRNHVVVHSKQSFALRDRITTLFITSYFSFKEKEPLNLPKQ